mmetsp:Transcript_13382/g.31404  ORF Transcript_13382/g.31404 Transcript_13382/m.31404 type:complete len:651 (-) Transcript_13382:107-2059(-)
MSRVDEQEPLQKRESDEPSDSDAHMPLRCTDLLCVIVFISFLGGMVSIMVYALRNGDPRRLTHGINWQGRFCGVDDNVSDKPLLYWCGEGNKTGIQYTGGVPTDFNLHGPICISECPTDDSEAYLCPMQSSVEIVETNTPEAQTKTTIIVQEAAPQPSYPTSEFMGRYCIPHPDDDDEAEDLYDRFVSSTAIGDTSEEFASAWGSIEAAVWPLVVTGIVAIVLTFVYLFLLQLFGKQLFYVSALLVFLMFLLLGLAFISTAFNVTGHQEDSPLFKHLEDDHAWWISISLGSICLILALLVSCLLCCFGHAVDTALACLSAAADCISHEWSLLVEPIIDVVFRLTLLVTLLVGFMWLASTGDITTDNSTTIGGVHVTGVKRSFSYTEDQIWMMVYYIFGSIWLLEFAHSLGQFVIAYMVVLWYYTPLYHGRKRSPWCPLPRAYIAALVFHLGTLAMGSFLIALCRIPQIILGYFAKQAKAKENPVLSCCVLCCKCCIDCFTRFLEYINQNAYVDVAINSNDFCTAARRSFEFILSNGAEIVLLSGATIVFSAIGVIFVSLSSALFVYWVVDIIPEYSAEDSENNVSNPMAVAIMGGILGLIISGAFMIVLDQTADTLLYTYTWNKAHDPETLRHYAPEALADLVARSKDSH